MISNMFISRVNERSTNERSTNERSTNETGMTRLQYPLEIKNMALFAAVTK